MKRTFGISSFLESTNEGHPSPAPIMEDNQSIITRINKDRLSSRVKQLDIIITWIHYHYNRDNVIPIYVKPHLNKMDTNTKPYGNETLQKTYFLSLVLNSILLTIQNIINSSNFTYIRLVNIEVHWFQSKNSLHLLHYKVTNTL